MESKRGCPTLGLGGWVLRWYFLAWGRYAHWAKTHLWPAPSLLYYLQLLSPATTFAIGARPRRSCSVSLYESGN